MTKSLTKFGKGLLIVVAQFAAWPANAQKPSVEEIFDAMRSADQHFADIRLIYRLYNRDFLDAMGRNIDPERDFNWRWLSNFDGKDTSALLVFHRNAYGCGMYLCSADLWIGDGDSPVSLGGFQLAYGEEIEVMDKIVNGYKIIIAAHRGYAFSPELRYFVDLNELQ